MRWLAIWLLLTGIYFAGQLAAPLFTGGDWKYTRESLAHLVAVPFVQVAALRIVALVRRHSRLSARRDAPRRPPPDSV